MVSAFEFEYQVDIAWCPGCGNYSILQAVRNAFDELGLDREKLVMVSGIGQAAKTPHYLKVNFFNGLHGRALPAATAIKASNPGLTVVVESGDGCMYGEGGNHFIAAIRRNPDITVIVHNNMVYGLTKGQASPTSQRGFTTSVQATGVYVEPFNPIAAAVALKASFVARALAGDVEKTKEVVKQAIQHGGFSLVDVFQPCVWFNRVNTAKWFKDHTYYLESPYDPADRAAAFEKSIQEDMFPLGVIYVNADNPAFEDNLPAYKTEKTALYERSFKKDALNNLMGMTVNE